MRQSKPWDTKGIDGVHRFLKKLWNLFFDAEKLIVEDIEASKEELKVLHKLIKKVSTDIEAFSFNTSISQFMITVNEFTQMKSKSKSLFRDLIVVLSPFAPHIAEELWRSIGEKTSVVSASWPLWNEEYLVEDTINYPISFNGKTRFTINLSRSLSKEEVEKIVMSDENTKKWLDDKEPKKVIVVPGRIVNIVL